MKPGRELDALVAEKVMGFRRATAETAPSFAYNINELGQVWFLSDYTPGTCFSTVPEYSTDIAAAWAVVEKLRETDLYCEIATFVDTYSVEISNMGEKIQVEAVTAPHAICLAALRALGVEVKSE